MHQCEVSTNIEMIKEILRAVDESADMIL